MKIRIRKWILNMMLPFIRLVSKLGKPEPRMTVDDYWKINNSIREGDVLLCTEYYRFSNLLIKGFWSHAAVYCGDGWVFEAVPNKCRIVHLSQFVLSKDAIRVQRALTFSLTWPRKLLELARKNDGKPYDFRFESGQSAWYCSEAVWNLLSECCNQPLPFTRRITWGEETVTPEDFLSVRHFTKVFERIG